MAGAALGRAVENGLADLSRSFAQADVDDAEFETDLKKVTSWLSSEVADSITRASQDYRSQSQNLRRQFLDRPEDYCDLFRYTHAEGRPVEPLYYAYSAEDGVYSLSDTPLKEDEDDIWLQRVYETDSGGTYYDHLLSPMEFTLGGPTMDRPAWVAFAKAIGGVVSLVEDPFKPKHPLHNWWRRTYETELGIQFVRRPGC